MKKQLLLWPLLALAAPVAAQHTELQARAGVGLFRFGGANAQSSSFVNYSNTPDLGYTNSPYGSHWGAGVALGGRAERVSARQGLLAFDLGYEWLQSRTNVTAVWGAVPIYSSYIGYYKADGSTALQTHNLTAFLGFGHRFAAGKVNVDALVGPEAVYILEVHEKGSGTYDYNGGTAWSTNQERRNPNHADARLRADVTVWHQRLGFNASYSHGFLNYRGGLLGASPEVYARVLRLGVVYRLR
ncbi:hypothetical protein [Hymenobacter properus]|uniref:Outer membrane protein beta-barrel domain-containing protein n=1 Tax=Hymenobacter properus TaxID=2791026 RepID=A0A931FMS6_9BACT|nr:hypothetical protein [Hymenobacter properus]MBF9141959.1 hypothetical protein [Hymenobacter properus]MBR7720766.1 hypothetical protein [Microvirga sp. SRT04]